MKTATKGIVAEWSKALALGASPKGRGFEPHQYHYFLHGGSSAFWPSILRVAVFWDAGHSLIQVIESIGFEIKRSIKAEEL